MSRLRNCYSITTTVTAAVALGLAAHGSAATVQYAVTDLGTLPDHIYSYAYGTNASGQVVGYSGASGGESLAFLWEDGVMTGLGTLGGSSSYAYSINDNGLVVGWSTNEEWYAHAFLGTGAGLEDLGTLGGSESFGNDVNNSGQAVGRSWLAADLILHAFFYDGEMIDLGTLGGETSEAWAINNLGQVVGNANASDGNVRAFLWSDGNSNGQADSGEMGDLGTLGGLDSFAYAINDLGEVVGSSETAGLEYHAFLYTDGDMTDLSTLGGLRSEAYAVNNLRQVVGWSDLFGWGSHAFLWQDGVMKDLNDLIPADSGWELLEAWDINDAGQIVGWGIVDGDEAAFLLTPFSFVVSAVDPSGVDGVFLSWDDLGDGYAYTVECCDSLAAWNWSPVPPVEQWPITATSWTDSTNSVTRECFYRIKAEKTAP